MRIYVAYKLSGADFEKLKSRLEEISKIIEELGHETFIFVRDVQNWKAGGLNPKEIMSRARVEMEKSDVLLAVLESAEKGEGLLIESGYMKGLGKKVIVASKGDCRGFLLKGIADEVFEFEDDEELEAGLNMSLDIV
jgi:nucleoside 2-deoxyribosyltransferase